MFVLLSSGQHSGLKVSGSVPQGHPESGVPPEPSLHSSGNSPPQGYSTSA